MSLTNTEFDIIFAGGTFFPSPLGLVGGAAACCTAGRLAAADPSLKILIVEAGPHTQEDPQHVQPARFLSHFTPDSKTVKYVVSNPSEHLGGRITVAPAGQCLGGGSSVNFTVYNRAAASDYDDWETEYNNPGWGAKDLLPLLKKTETYQIDPEGETHGASGPLKVSYGGHFPNVAKDFLEVAATYDKERKLTEDPNDLYNSNAYGRWPKWIDEKTGRRSDTPHHFIYNQVDNKNLRVLTGSFVKRVIIKDGRAVGVEYVPNPQLHPDASPEPLAAYASKLVVVCGGSFGSPLILERSGIGAAEILKKFGVEQVVDLPGVGERYQDHQHLVALCRTSEDADTLDYVMRGIPEEIEKWDTQWKKDGTGFLAINGLDAGIKLRPTESELKTIGPAFLSRWRQYYADAPDKSVMWLACVAFCMDAIATAPMGKYYGIGYCLNHPESMGRVHITSGEDATVLPNWDSGFLEHESDMELHMYAYKRCRELARRMPCFRGEYRNYHPDFALDSPAAVNEDTVPVAMDAPDIVYTNEDNKAIREWVRKLVATTWHSLGTCAMMPREQGGVVDSRLNVYGVEGLKVADLSIAPYNVGANTYSTALVIAEKAAVLIGEELGITGV
ncbi:GMC oxidoreductase-domain-containing protein [Cristinia sonorae]|uniref:GMC oxidoreductase-domain-containing protein n=1 Tax=Cristinia sonorae TaxID=1940300 RepID=A0A8K0UDJ2_9AGAR|nr:GMC oxidoreductase-domain-containing protein [Cristinia sonorae]